MSPHPTSLAIRSTPCANHDPLSGVPCLSIWSPLLDPARARTFELQKHPDPTPPPARLPVCQYPPGCPPACPHARMPARHLSPNYLLCLAQDQRAKISRFVIGQSSRVCWSSGARSLCRHLQILGYWYQYRPEQVPCGMFGWGDVALFCFFPLLLFVTFLSPLLSLYLHTHHL